MCSAESCPTNQEHWYRWPEVFSFPTKTLRDSKKMQLPWSKLEGKDTIDIATLVTWHLYRAAGNTFNLFFTDWKSRMKMRFNFVVLVWVLVEHIQLTVPTDKTDAEFIGSHYDYNMQLTHSCRPDFISLRFIWCTWKPESSVCLEYVELFFILMSHCVFCTERNKSVLLFLFVMLFVAPVRWWNMIQLFQLEKQIYECV